jgi:hypothetical protein
MKELLPEISDSCNESEASYNKREPETNKTLDTYRKLRDNTQVEPATRMLAAYVTENECDKMLILLEQRKMLNLIYRLAVSATLSMTNIDNEVKRLRKPSALPTEADKNKISNLEKELVKLRRVTKEWKPIIDDLKEGQERTKKYLGNHR